MNRIRAIAIAIIRRGGSLLVFEGQHDGGARPFYRPLGGGIEFGERGGDAIVRELREEIGADLHHVRYLGTLENIFTHDGRPGHEIVLVYEAALTDPALYAREEMTATEDDGSKHRVLWLNLEDCRAGRARLVPDHLLDFLEAHGDAA
jgi:ADP-ribose pyrophosphatase YjhB (NUDIX family)